MTSQSTQPTKNQDSKLFGSLKKLGRSLLASAAEIGEPIAKPLFAINRTSAIIRSTIFIAFAVFWISWAYLIQLPDFTQANIIGTEVATDPISAMTISMKVLTAKLFALIIPLFGASIFRHIMTIMLAFWVTFKIAAIYLDDIFVVFRVNWIGQK